MQARRVCTADELAMVKRAIYFDKDMRLMLKIADGDRTAYERLYKKYLPVVADYLVSLNSHEAMVKDLVQEVFMRLWEHRTSYRFQASLKTYLFSCARNVLSEKIKQIAKDREIIHRLFLQYPNKPSDFSSNPESMVSQTELVKATRQAISRLSPKQKQAIRLFYNTGASISECAKRAKCSVPAFKGRLFRARERLFQLLQADEQGE